MTFKQSHIHSLSENPYRVDTTALPPLPIDSSSDVSSLIEPYRWELHLHCYRMLGSLIDAEDLVQETMLRAWKRFDTFQGSASLRTWLYTIATNACLDVLKKNRSRRTLPQSSYPATDPRGPLAPPIAEPIWLEPFPNFWLVETPGDPEASYTRRESVSLAFLVALQLLPPRQRAILILIDVLDWSASEAARLLEISVSAVNSALHRARTTLAKNYQHHGDLSEHDLRQVSRADAETSALLTRYMEAWETDDVDGLVALLKEDATFTMPPYPFWCAGRDPIQTILIRGAFRPGVRGGWRLFPTEANTLPAFVLYREDPAKSVYEAFGVQLVRPDSSTADRQIAEIVIFNLPALVGYFGFPPQLPASG